MDKQQRRLADLRDELYRLVGQEAGDRIISDILEQAESYQRMLEAGARRPSSEARFTVHDVPEEARGVVEGIIGWIAQRHRQPGG